MFDRIKDLWRRVRAVMFDKGTINNAIRENIAMSDAMSQALKIWSEMYTNGEQLQLPSAIAGEMARLVSIEMKSVVSGSSRADFINKKYSDVINDIRIPLEYGCAKGGLIFKPYVNNGSIEVDYIQADSFFPLRFNNSGMISAAVFIERIVKGSTYYTRLERHELNGTIYTIKNTAYMSLSADTLGNTVSLDSIDEWSELSEEMSFNNIKQPLFGHFKPALANTIDPSSPLGVSVYSKAVELIEEADEQFKRLLWEFESGERALYANSMAFQVDKNGKPKLPHTKLYKTLDVEDMDLFKEWTPTLRESEITNGLSRIFRQIEFNCGLAYGTLSDVQNVDKTAEEIKASKQRSYATVCDNQKALQSALTDLVYAMDVWCTLYNLAPMGAYDISFEFDDSIVADRKTEFAEKQALVSVGIMQPWEFRMWYFGEDEATAKGNVSNEFEETPEI
jgi:A118 family predicted phage portal protein